MRTITKVSCENVRGITKTVELKPKTLIVGPNGKGKSTIVHSISLAVDGYIHDTKKENKAPAYVFANSSGEEMSVSATVAEKMIERTWALNKKGSIGQTVKVEGHKTNKGGAEGMIEMAVGKGKIIIDVPAFWNQSATEQQRIVLGAAIDPDVLESIMEDESRIREEKNALADDRRAAEKALQNTTEQLAEMDQPEGNLDHIKQELEKFRAEEGKLRQKVAEAEANERARTEMRGVIGQLPEAEKELEYVEEKLKHTEGVVENLGTALEKHTAKKPEAPVARLQEGPIADTIRELIVDLSSIDTGDFLGTDPVNRLKVLLPDPEADKAQIEVITKWDAQRCLIIRELEAAKKQANELSKQNSVLVERITSAREAGDKLASIGPGVDSNDVTALKACSDQIKELNGQIEPLAELAALNGILEKTRLDIERITNEEDAKKDELAELTKRQAELVQGANDNLARLSKEVLPYGELELIADGKSLSIFWAMGDGKKVRRHTLSGGELAIFDAAVGHALGEDATVVIEAAECDDEHLVQLMDHLGPMEFQVVVLTCHQPPFTIPEAWSMIEVA